MGPRHVFTQESFSCTLTVQRCLARTRRGHRQCQRRSFRHPYCLAHARIYMGVYPSVSTIPQAGLGLFASRDLKKGDVIGPYTGEVFQDLAMLRDHRGGVVPIYSMHGSHGTVVDASRTRGYGGYINEPPRQGGRCNVRWKALTVPRGEVTTSRGLVVSRKLRRLGWRRISSDLLRAFGGHSLPWMWLTMDVPKDAELFLPYRSGGAHHRTMHETSLTRMKEKK